MIRNSLDGPMRVRGLIERSPLWQQVGLVAGQALLDSAATVIDKDAVREIRFRATLPGTYYYWGWITAAEAAATATRAQRRPTAGQRMDLSTREDGQVVGALIVDPASGSLPDRVFVLTQWRVPGTMSIDDPATARQINVINGLSWPHSEKLTATVGDTVRWRVLNVAAGPHTMHLHGFYFRVLSSGAVSAFDSIYVPDLPVSGERVHAAEPNQDHRMGARTGRELALPLSFPDAHVACSAHRSRFRHGHGGQSCGSRRSCEQRYGRPDGRHHR